MERLKYDQTAIGCCPRYTELAKTADPLSSKEALLLGDMADIAIYILVVTPAPTTIHSDAPLTLQ